LALTEHKDGCGYHCQHSLYKENVCKDVPMSTEDSEWIGRLNKQKNLLQKLLDEGADIMDFQKHERPTNMLHHIWFDKWLIHKKKI
jgi:hypothetical protein